MEARSFEADERVVDGVPVLSLAGELDYGTVAAVQERLDRLLVRGHNVVVDLMAVSLLTSAVINVLFAAVRRIRLADGCLAIACSDPTVCKVLELTSLDRAAPVLPTVAEAVATVRNALEN